MSRMFQSIRDYFTLGWQYIKVYKKPAFQAFDMKNAFITLDQAFDYVGDNSSYQQRITILLSLQFLFYSFFVMGMPYLFQEHNHSCVSLPRVINSISDEFMKCGQQTPKSFIAALFFVGQMFGGFVFPILADLLGRRRILLLGSFLGSAAIICGGFSANLDNLYIAFFIAGFGLSGYETVVYVYITEISAIRFRSIASSLLVVVWGSAMLVYPFIVDALDYWRDLMKFAIGLPLLILTFISYFYYVESPRWLAQKERFNECRQVFRYMSIFNKRKPFEFNFIEEMDNFSNQCIQLKSNANDNYINIVKQTNSFSFWSKLNQSKLVRTTFILISMWFFRYFTYYGLQFSVNSFGMSVTVVVRLLALAELVTAVSSCIYIIFYILQIYIKLKYQRLTSLQYCLFIMTLSCSLTFVNIPQGCENKLCWEEMLQLTSAIMLKSAITFYNSILNTYTGEVFVTSLRSYGYGICMTLGQMGSSIAPVYVEYVAQYENFSPMTIVAALSIMVAITTYFLPETLNQPMFDRLDEELAIGVPHLATEQEMQTFGDDIKG